MKRLTMVGLLMALAVFAFALSTFSKVFATTYKVEKDSALGKAACMVCHVSAKGGKLNSYGLELDKAMAEAKTKKMTIEILKKVEQLDSDGDGVKNIDEIKGDRMPGVKGS
ncbi:MAG: hypothetical protein M9921_02805 [Fimbriimonadaceae bacterium]|nr:hypothetical protein [Chthonomonadaceae bacterium]MCO5295763.1 hypothetical protein [Fimbriimonadaceae bacterium]